MLFTVQRRITSMAQAKLCISTDQRFTMLRGTGSGGFSTTRMAFSASRLMLKWLAGAVYPVTIDPEFGYHSIGGQWVRSGNSAFGSAYATSAFLGRYVTYDKCLLL